MSCRTGSDIGYKNGRRIKQGIIQSELSQAALRSDETVNLSFSFFEYIEVRRVSSIISFPESSSRASVSASMAGSIMDSAYAVPLSDKCMTLLRRSDSEVFIVSSPAARNFFMIALTVCFVAASLSHISDCRHPFSENHRICRTKNSFTVRPCRRA